MQHSTVQHASTARRGPTARRGRPTRRAAASITAAVLAVAVALAALSPVAPLGAQTARARPDPRLARSGADEPGWDAPRPGRGRDRLGADRRCRPGAVRGWPQRRPPARRGDRCARRAAQLHHLGRHRPVAERGPPGRAARQDAAGRDHRRARPHRRRRRRPRDGAAVAPAARRHRRRAVLRPQPARPRRRHRVRPRHGVARAVAHRRRRAGGGLVVPRGPAVPRRRVPPRGRAVLARGERQRRDCGRAAGPAGLPRRHGGRRRARPRPRVAARSSAGRRLVPRQRTHRHPQRELDRPRRPDPPTAGPSPRRRTERRSGSRTRSCSATPPPARPQRATEERSRTFRNDSPLRWSAASRPSSATSGGARARRPCSDSGCRGSALRSMPVRSSPRPFPRRSPFLPRPGHPRRTPPPASLRRPLPPTHPPVHRTARPSPTPLIDGTTPATPAVASDASGAPSSPATASVAGAAVRSPSVASAPSSGAATLATTGSETPTVLGAALVLIGLGAMLVAGARPFAARSRPGARR